MSFHTKVIIVYWLQGEIVICNISFLYKILTAGKILNQILQLPFLFEQLQQLLLFLLGKLQLVGSVRYSNTLLTKNSRRVELSREV